MAKAMKESFDDPSGEAIRRWIDDARDLNVKDNHDFTALMIASKRGLEPVVDLLLQRNVELEAQNMAGDTALHIAAQEGNKNVVQILIENGSKVNAANDNGNTPLHYACFYRRQEIAELLLEAGALLGGLNKNKKSPEIFAGPMGPKLREIVSQTGGKLDSVHMKGRSMDLVEAEAKAKHIASTRKQLWDMTSKSILLGDLLYMTEQCEYYQATSSNLTILAKKLKIKNSKRPPSSADIENLRTTMKPLQTLFHKNLVTVMGLCAEKFYIAVAYELSGFSAANLETLLHDDDVMLNPLQVLSFANDAISALQYLHSQKLAHLNLKSRNLLIQQSYEGRRVACIDYSLHNTLLGHFQDRADKLFEPQWVAPEILRDAKVEDAEKADVYSFGILLHEMVTRTYPYDGMNAMHLGLKVGIEGMRPSIPAYVPPQLQQLMELCWDEEIHMRPSIEEVKKIVEEMMEIEEEEGNY